MRSAQELIEALVESGLVTVQLSRVKRSIESMKSADRFTPFSGWYKGEHGRIRVELIRNLRGLIDALKKSMEPEENARVGEVQEYLQGVQTKDTPSIPPSYLR